MKKFCKDNNIYVNNTKKVVVAKDEQEVEGIKELKKRADINGVETSIITQEELANLDSNIKTHKIALYSPNTASVDPKEVCYKLRDLLISLGIDIYFDLSYEESTLEYDYLINSAGLYADKIAKSHGIADDYILLPFKGIYLKYKDNNRPISTNIYPVPNLANPFLGVHYTITVDGSIKIGPTAIPAFWRENYKGFDNFSLSELCQIFYYEAKLFILNSFNFRNLAITEMQNYNKRTFIQKAKDMVYKVNDNFEPIPAGIRAQLLNTKTNELVQDFVIEHTENSTHILNAVSPAFTCAFSFAEYVVSEITNNKTKQYNL
jgi:L-2-hydroxyglutarate oxidase LhgO